jgi:TolB-like protein/DNA-binding winged helix-turn-helix (wHTH) protein/Flp pilus assembly protein TadD
LVVSNFILGMAHATEQRIYEFGDFRIDVDHRMLYHQGSETPLVPKAVETLLALIERRGKIISKDELLEAVWPDTVVEESSLFVYLSVLRKTLGTLQDGRPYVETLRRRGYRFNGEVHLVEEAVEDKNYGLSVDEFEQSRTNIQSQAVRLHVVKKIIEPIDSFRSATTDSLSVNDLPTDPSVWRQTNPAVNDLPESRRDWPLRRSSFAAIGVIALVAALALSYTYFFSRRSIHSIAVMPFTNENGDPKLEYLSDGLTGNLIESLSKVPGLEVKALSTVVRYKGANSDARRIGKELNVEAVLFGHLIETGEDLTLQVELVDSRNGNNLWRRTYPKKVSGLVVLQSELARDLVGKLSVPITDKTQEKLAKHDTENSDANRLYLSGVFHQRKLTEQDIKKAIDLFWQAIHKDPEYARAYAAIASAHRSLTMCCDGHPAELMRGRDAAQKAVALDPELAEGHSALAASIYSYDWNWAEAEKEFLRALELDPNSSTSHRSYAEFLERMGRPKEAFVQGERARELEPLSPYANTVGAAREPEKAVERIRFAIDLDPNFYFSHSIAAVIYGGRKMYTEAIEEARLAKALSPDQTWSDVILSGIFVNAGRPEDARAILDQLLLRSKSRFVPPYHIARVYNNVGDKERALDWLEKAYDIRDPKMTFLKTMNWKNVENEPRFQDILRRVGFVGSK